MIARFDDREHEASERVRMLKAKAKPSEAERHELARLEDAKRGRERPTHLASR